MPTNFSKGGPDVKSNDFMQFISTVNTDPRVDYWHVTWVEYFGRGASKKTATYKTEAEAMAKVNELRAITLNSDGGVTNVKVEKATVQ